MEKVVKIITELTALTEDKDLFAYDIPLATAGAWLQDNQTDSRFNGVDSQVFSIFYRDKSKSKAVTNIKYLKDTLDGLRGSTGTCKLQDGTTFRLDVLNTWDYIAQDSEGYYVFTNQLRLFN
jgi:hypothetical protein